jgi:hypothetical protein
MRVWFVVLLMALLPLRGWVGDAMAVSMALQPVSATLASAADCHGTDDHGAQAHGNHHGTDAPDNHGQTHLLCDLCNGPALTPATALAVVLDRPQGLRVPARVAFASEPLRRDVRPPIA